MAGRRARYPPGLGDSAQEVSATIPALRNHLTAIYAKLDIHSKVELVRRLATAPPK